MFFKTRRALVALSAGVLAAGLATSLTGCSTDGSPAGSQGVEGSPSANPAMAPTFAAMGTANDNIAYFRHIISQSISREGLNASTEGVAKSLVAGGFDKKGVQFSDNYTAAGMKPDSVTVATEFHGQCLIAQYGPSIHGLTVSLLPVLASGGCLLGRSINHL
jgi:hypothetical protein